MIIIKSAEEIELIRQSCQLVVESFALIKKVLRPGIKTMELDQLVAEYLSSKGATPAFKGYRGFPANICVSIDEQVVHGLPGSQIVKDGQLVSIDIGVILNQYFGDAARTFAVGQVSDKKKCLLNTTREALYKGIQAAREGNRVSDISKAIQQHAESNGYSVVRDYIGHGVGRQLHEEPPIPNYYFASKYNPRLKAGMVLAIEPMLNIGTHHVIVEGDKWTVSTRDGLPSAHYEHTIVVTKAEAEILTNDPIVEENSNV